MRGESGTRRPPAGDPSGRRRHFARRCADRANPRSVCLPPGFCTEHRETATAGFTVVAPDDGVVDAPVGDDSHIPAPTCSRVSRRRNSSTVSPRRHLSWSRNSFPNSPPSAMCSAFFRRLLRERVSVRDLTTILAAFADALAIARDPDMVRSRRCAPCPRSRDLSALPEREGWVPVIALSLPLEGATAGISGQDIRCRARHQDPSQAQRFAPAHRRRLGSAVAQPVLPLHASTKAALLANVLAVLPHSE